MDTLPELAPAGLGTLLALIVIYLLRANAVDRKEHRAERLEWDARYQAQKAEHDAEESALRERLADAETNARSETLRANKAEGRLARRRDGTVE